MLLTPQEALIRSQKAAAILTAIGSGYKIQFHEGQKVWVDCEPVPVCVLEHPELYRIKAIFEVGDTVRNGKYPERVDKDHIVIKVDEKYAHAIRYNEKGHLIAVTFDKTTGHWVQPLACKGCKMIVVK